MVKGLIVNKFRGDKTILDPGVEMIEKLCKIPAVGVVPYMDVDIEDEDSLSSRLTGGRKRSGREVEASEWQPAVDIAVIRFPRLSNFTDFNVFEGVPGASLRYVEHLSDLGTPDMILLPGTKNTIADLLWMRQNGLEAAVMKAARRGTPVWGICGGYQMMGEELRDDEGTENGTPGYRAAGMCLFPSITRFCEEKTRTRVRGTFGNVTGIFSELSGMESEGYEIHMGETSFSGNGEENSEEAGEGTKVLRLLTLSGEPQGSAAAKQDGFCCDNLYGTYVHGVFDAPGVAGAIVRALLAKKGIEMPEGTDVPVDYDAYREQQYDRLASILREHLNMEEIYRILEDGIH